MVRLPILVIILFIYVIVSTILFCAPVKAHGVHFSDVASEVTQNVVAQGWVGGTYVFATDSDGDGLPDIFWRVYKDGDLAHQHGVCLHIEPLTRESATILLQRKEKR